VFVASILPAFGVYYSAAGLLSGLVIVAIILIGQVLFGLLFAKRKFAIMTALMAIFISAASIAIIGAQSIQLFVPNHDADADAFLAFGIFLVVFLITFAQFIYAVSLSFLEKTAETQEQYSNELKKRDSAIRSLQNRVAKVIHADIQAKLRAILLRVKTGGITEGNIGELNQDLEYINSVLASIGDEEAVDFAVELQGLVEFWSGVCDIRLEVEREVVEVLALRPDLSRAALDVLAEGVSNAVKHAEAKSATIALSLTSQSLEISVSNPTSAVKIEALSTGQGGRHLDRVAASWRLESTENSTILLVSLAL
jgi:signal transduction histidine kinase